MSDVRPETALAHSTRGDLVKASADLIRRGLEILSPSGLLSAIQPLALAIETRSGRDLAQVLRIKTYAVSLGRTVRMSHGDLQNLELATLLRNIGMFAFSDSLAGQCGGRHGVRCGSRGAIRINGDYGLL